jgi:hypothetical protein
MALSDLSFKFYTDSGLTTSYSGTTLVNHNTDLSDNPQDFVLYFGSAEAEGTRTLEATSNPGVDNITLTPTDTVASWAAATAYVLGDIVEPTTPNTYRYKCTTAGTSHASTEPTWPTTPIGSTVTDGTVTWTLVSKKHPITECKLALTSGGLAGATAGAALVLGTTLESGVANAVEVNIRITNTVTTVVDTTGRPDFKLYINEVIEAEV